MRDRSRIRVKLKNWDDLSEWCEGIEEKLEEMHEDMGDGNDGEELVGSALDHPMVKPIVGQLQTALAQPGGLDAIIKGLVQRVKKALAEEEG